MNTKELENVLKDFFQFVIKKTRMKDFKKISGLLKEIWLEMYASGTLENYSERCGDSLPRFLRGIISSGGICEMCGAKVNIWSVQVHHIEPKRSYPYRYLDPRNLIALCPKCHEAISRQNADVLRSIGRIRDAEK